MEKIAFVPRWLRYVQRPTIGARDFSKRSPVAHEETDFEDRARILVF